MLSAGCLCNSALTRNGAVTFVIANTNAKIAIVGETNGSNAALAESRPFLYQKNVLLFVHEKRQVEILENIAKEFQVFVVISSVIKDIYELPKIYKQILEVTSLLQNKTF